MLANKYRASAAAGVCLWMLTLAGAVLLACETPVYRYAMYRWTPEPYEVYYFYEGESNAAADDVHKALEEAAEEWANVALIKVDLAVENAIERVPPDVHQWWMSEENRKPPLYLVKNPKGFVVHSGELSVDDVADMVQSPARQALGERLERGEAAVFVLLEGANATANQIAARELAGVVKDVNSGKIDLYSSPLAALPGGSESGGISENGVSENNLAENNAVEAKASASKVKVGYVVVSRDNPKERWLIDSLLAVESDLPELTGPMVFAVYGRARALPPYVGAGITRDNLQDCIEFVTGACSCTVKEENPGVDLLLTYNWDDAALALKERFGSEEGNESQFGGLDLFPQLIVAGEVPEDEDTEPAETPPTAESPAVESVAVAETTTKTKDSDASDNQPAVNNEVALVDAVEESNNESATGKTAMGETATVDPLGGASFTHTENVHVTYTLNTPLFLIVGAGVGLALFMLIGATFFMFRGH